VNVVLRLVATPLIPTKDIPLRPMTACGAAKGGSFRKFLVLVVGHKTPNLSPIHAAACARPAWRVLEAWAVGQGYRVMWADDEGGAS